MIRPNFAIGDNVLVTCDNWFYAPDGKCYRAVWGTVRAVQDAESVLGVRPNAKSTNWYLEVGNMILAGCQIHYLVKADRVSFEPVEAVHVHEGRSIESRVPTAIYNANEAST